MNFLLAVCGISFGLLAAAGVFTVFLAVGMIPRFAAKTKTIKYIRLYETMVILGTVIGGTSSLFQRYLSLEALLSAWGINKEIVLRIGKGITGIYGFFSGIFIGCLAMTIAEMLDTLPIFMRRIRLKSGLKQLIFAMALGKMLGSLFYFLWQ